MGIKTAHTDWQGGVRDGKGLVVPASNSFQADLSFYSIFGDGEGSNGSELVSVAISACFSMSLAAVLESAGHPSQNVHTDARVHVERLPDGVQISRIELLASAYAPGVEESAFQQIASKALAICPVCKALASVPIELTAELRKDD